MATFVALLPLAPLRVGRWIARSRWPRHVTVVGNLVAEAADLDVLAAIIRRVASDTTAPSVRIGADAAFGRRGEVPVQLVESGELAGVHERLLDAFEAHVALRSADPDHARSGYRPHITIAEGGPLERGSTVDLDSIVLAELGPDGDSSRAVIVAGARFGEPADGPAVPAASAAGALQAIASAGIRCWAIGGWGIDALLGEETRDHHDLDLFVEAADVAAFVSLAEETGGGLRYLWSENRWSGDLPSAFVADLGGIDVDVHVVETGGDGIRILAEHSIALPADALDGIGTIDGMRVRCATPDAQLLMHSGYELPEHQRRDLDLVRGRGLTTG